MNKRIEKILKLIDEKNVDAVLISDKYNRRYISGFTGSAAQLYISKNQSCLITDFRYIEQATNEAESFTIININNEGYNQIIKGLLNKDQGKSLLIEDASLTYSEYLYLESALQGITLVPAKSAIDETRMVKDDEEIRRLQEAERIGDNAFSHILSVLKPGISELDVAIELEFFMRKQGASGLSFESIVASGVHSSMPHAHPTQKLLNVGDFVTMDFGCIFEGYCSDMTRTVVIGKADEKQKEIYNIVLEAQLKGLEAVRADVRGFEVDKVARDIITNAGYGDYFGHGLGHSVGLFIHESPRLSIMGQQVLKENMIATVEPGIYLPNWGGVRIEDMVVIKENGHVNLTNSTKELLEIS